MNLWSWLDDKGEIKGLWFLVIFEQVFIGSDIELGPVAPSGETENIAQKIARNISNFSTRGEDRLNVNPENLTHF